MPKSIDVEAVRVETMVNPCVKKRGAASAAGGVLIEFLVTLPLMLMFLAGILETGRFFSQISRIAQVSYQVALVGATNPEGGNTPDLMAARFQQLANLGFISYVQELTLQSPAYDIEGSSDTVSTSITGQLPSLLPGIMNLNLHVNVQVAGPVLARDVSNIGNENNFCNSVVATECL